jgi:hypothetical protein
VTLTTTPGATAESRGAINEEQVHQFTHSLFGEDLHAKRVLSVALATLGVIHAASLSVHAVIATTSAEGGMADAAGHSSHGRSGFGDGLAPPQQQSPTTPHILDNPILRDVGLCVDST